MSYTNSVLSSAESKCYNFHTVIWLQFAFSVSSVVRSIVSFLPVMNLTYISNEQSIAIMLITEGCSIEYYVVLWCYVRTYQKLLWVCLNQLYLMFLPVYLTQNLVLLSSKQLNREFVIINDWFKSNLLSLNFDKSYYVQFRTKYSYEININISCGNKLITTTHSTKFLVWIIDNILSLKSHSDKLMPKLSKACYAIRAVKSFMSQEVLRMIYLFYVRSIMTCGIILGGNSSDSIFLGFK